MEVTQTDSLSLVANGVTGLQIVMVNVFAIEQPDGGWSLVDAGLYWSAHRIRKWADSHFGGRPPSQILLTHGHFDHVGSLRELADEWNVPIFAHPLEAPNLTGRSKYPPPDPSVGRGLMALMSPLYPRGPIDVGDRLRFFAEDGSIPNLPDWRWIHTPGHTAGHVSFFREPDGVLIAGDAVVTTRQESLLAVMSQREEFNGPPAYFTSDWDAASLSVQRLADLQPTVLACGHGLPVSGPEASNRLSWLADNFDSWARPQGTRYAHQPALTDERGYVWAPPRPLDATTVALAGAGLLAAVALTRSLARRRSARA